MWCALLSLPNAASFVEEARRLAPVPDPRGHHNLAVHERYGDEVLPWLADHLDASGALHNVPWSVAADPSQFDSGASSTDRRKHAKFKAS